MENVQIHCKYDELVDPKKLVDYELNPNKHGQDQIERLGKLMQHLGIRHPIVVCKERNVIAAGHARKLAAIRIGLKKFPVVYQEFSSDEEFYAFVNSDNAISEWSNIDMAEVNAMMENLGPEFDLELLGFKNFTVDYFEKDIKQTKNTSKEIDQDEFKEFEHQCPKCGFEWNN